MARRDESRPSFSKAEYVLNSVNNALRILEAFTLERPEMSVSELSRLLGISRSAAFRLLVTLELRGFISQDPVSGRYRLGVKLVHLGGLVRRQLTLTKEARPYLEALSRECEETTHLAILDRDEVIFIDKVESQRPVRMGSYIGARMPAYCTATGKALLAYQPQGELERYLQSVELRALTQNTITDRHALAAHLAAVRAQGYAVDRGESEEGLMCVAAPVLGPRGAVVAAVSVSGPMVRLEPRETELAGKVKQTAAAIAAAMGYVQAPA